MARNLADLLTEIRGHVVEVHTPDQVEGAILGVEHRRVSTNQLSEERDFLNLKTAAGLRSIPMETIRQIRLVDDTLDSELRQSLEILSSSNSNDKMKVTLQFRGEGKRQVRVGYVQEFPVWKTSYRLVVADKDSAFLQGWAIVENTTEHDWENVQLTLVSGRPVSFVI